MIRKDGYKLIVYPYAGVRRLFNIVEDPEEVNDLARNADHQVRLEDMFNELTLLQKEMGDTLRLEAFNFSI